MAFICCDDHNLSVEADGIDPAAAKRLMLDDSAPAPSAIAQEVKAFGREHRDCSVRILANQRYGYQAAVGVPPFRSSL